jgi:hypothetical protein
MQIVRYPNAMDDEPVQERPPVEVVVPALLAVAVRHVAVRVDGAAERGDVMMSPTLRPNISLRKVCPQKKHTTTS